MAFGSDCGVFYSEQAWIAWLSGFSSVSLADDGDGSPDDGRQPYLKNTRFTVVEAAEPTSGSKGLWVPVRLWVLR